MGSLIGSAPHSQITTNNALVDGDAPDAMLGVNLDRIVRDGYDHAINPVKAETGPEPPVPS